MNYIYMKNHTTLPPPPFTLYTQTLTRAWLGLERDDVGGDGGVGVLGRCPAEGEVAGSLFLHPHS